MLPLADTACFVTRTVSSLLCSRVPGAGSLDGSGIYPLLCGIIAYSVPPGGMCRIFLTVFVRERTLRVREGR